MDPGIYRAQPLVFHFWADRDKYEKFVKSTSPKWSNCDTFKIL